MIAHDLHLDLSSLIDAATFDQILEMDDPDSMEFSRSIVDEFFIQAQQTFDEMDESLAKNDLGKLSSLGHFLKGSSATLGIIKMKKACEMIQNFGACLDESGLTPEPDQKLCLDRIKKTLPRMRDDFQNVKTLLEKFYENT
ncbi:signal transduction histidine kinase [Peziza echinospora]|nr:signal transduction histidine kinase [Peziza echinospora]